VVGAVFRDEALDDVVGGLIGAGVEDLDAAGLGGLVGAGAFAIEDGYDVDAGCVLVLGEGFDDGVAREGGATGVHGADLGPGEDHAVAINDEDSHGRGGGVTWGYPEGSWEGE